MIHPPFPASEHVAESLLCVFRLGHGIYGAVIDRLKANGERIAPGDLVLLSPARYDHINPYGHSRFRVDRWADQKPLRPIKV